MPRFVGKQVTTGSTKAQKRAGRHWGSEVSTSSTSSPLDSDWPSADSRYQSDDGSTAKTGGAGPSSTRTAADVIRRLEHLGRFSDPKTLAQLEGRCHDYTLQLLTGGTRWTDPRTSTLSDALSAEEQADAARAAESANGSISRSRRKPVSLNHSRFSE